MATMTILHFADTASCGMIGFAHSIRGEVELVKDLVPPVEASMEVSFNGIWVVLNPDMTPLLQWLKKLNIGMIYVFSSWLYLMRGKKCLVQKV